MRSLGRNGMICIGLGATAGTGLIAFLIFREVKRRRAESATPETRTDALRAASGTDTQDPVLARLSGQAEVLESAVQCLSPEQHMELRNSLDEVLMCVSGLRNEVAELRGGLRDIATTIIEDVKRCVEESVRSRRRRHLVPRERSDSMSSSSIYFSASAGPASFYGGEDSEAGYSTANADSDYTDRETDREGAREEDTDSKDEDDDDEERSCATVLTLQPEDSQPEEEEEEEEEDMVEEEDGPMGMEVTAEIPSAELALLLTQSDSLHAGDDGRKAEGFHLLRSHKMQFGDSVEFLWRLARAYSDICDVTEDAEERRSYAFQGREEAEAALRRNGLNAECHKWFAVLTGLGSQYESMHAKLKSCHLLKEHLDRAIALRDDDPLCFYLLGRWSYEVSSLGWLEKKAAAALYQSPPSSSLHDALENFLKAEELDPGFSKTVRLYIAKCHKDLGNMAEAANWAQLALRMPRVTREDTDIFTLEEELRALIGTATDSSGDQ